jgi:iron complex outermembrane recepter protein
VFLTTSARLQRAVTAKTVLAMLLITPPISGQDPGDLTTLNLDDLLNLRVTSAARHEEQLRHVPGAVYVVTADDIRKSGMTDLAEILRFVPGIDVARINSYSWAVTARGFNAQYAGKLLVVMDGRIIYDPGFSGVFWNLQNVVIQDIERIEVSRGPGATMWGANAVNGVISIVTKSAESTQGGQFVTSAGTEHVGEGSVRYGGAIGKNAFYRLSGRQTTRLGFETPSDKGSDSWNMTSGNLRIDWAATRADSFSLTAEGYRSVSGSRLFKLTSLDPIQYSPGKQSGYQGGYLLARWTHTSAASELKVQSYFDRREHKENFPKTLTIIGLDVQHRIMSVDRHDIVWGVDYRQTRDSIPEGFGWSFTPTRENTGMLSAFLQDEMAVVRDRLFLTLGSKFEKHESRKTETQPSARLVWLPSRQYSVWTAVSRAARTPNRGELTRDVFLYAFPLGPTPAVGSLTANPNMGSEHVMAYEAGVRRTIGSRAWIDVASFRNTYTHLATLETGAPYLSDKPAPLHWVFPAFSANKMQGETYGVEVAARYKMNSFLHFKGGYSLLRTQLRLDADSTDIYSGLGEEASPRSQINLSSTLSLPHTVEISGSAFYVGARPSYQIPGYTRLDVNVTWSGLENLELSLNGQNLLGRHMEFIGDFPIPEVPRTFNARLAWRF